MRPGVAERITGLGIHAPDFEDARRRWLAGDCPCCGMAAWMPDGEPYLDGTEAEAIGEGVHICGRCVASGHVTDEAIRTAMLLALLP